MESNIEIFTISDRRATISEVYLCTGKNHFEALGSSRRMSGDPYDEEFGNLLALRRALRDLDAKLSRYVKSRSRELDAVIRNAKEAKDVQAG